MQKTSKLNGITLQWRVFDTLSACEPLWRACQEQAIMTVFQRFEWLSAWQETIGASSGIEPAIVAGIADDEVKILFPLALDRRLGARRLTWLGVNFCDYTMPLIAPEFADGLSPHDAAAIWRDICDVVGGVDYVQLEKQPLTINGFDNPFADHNAREYSAKAYSLKLGDDWESFYMQLRSSKTRRRLREKENRLKKAGDLVFRQVFGHEAIRHSIATMLDWKVAQIVSRGMMNPFANPAVDDFLTRVAATEPKFARFYSLDLDDEMLAGCLALVDHKSLVVFQMAYGLGPHSRHSPGRILINRMMEQAISEGVEIFDFSLGDEPYKLDVCDIHTELMQTAHAVTPVGWIPALAYSTKILAKRQIKASERLSEAVFALNRNAYKLGFADVGRELPPQPEAPVSDVRQTVEKPT